MPVIRIFLSSPSDVDQEQAEVAQLVREINDTIHFLTPERELRLELVHYETHSYPDVGTPQEVIDRQIPIDFEIYLGIMWRRAGTPTSDHPSGTIHEFYQALEHRQEHGWPTIMFFFSDEQIAMPTSDDDIDQLRTVVAFRNKLSSIGLTTQYPDRSVFREVLRGRLLRALADVIATPDEEAPAIRRDARIDEEAMAAMRALARRYDAIRATMSSGRERTRLMTSVFGEMVAAAPSVRSELRYFQTGESAGDRLAAIAVLNAFPSEAELGWLAQRLDNPRGEKPFVGYQAALALRQAVQSLPDSALPELRIAVDDALRLASRLPDDADRINVVRAAVADLERRERR